MRHAVWQKERRARLIMGREIKSTVIIPNYNGMRYMENCLRALEGEPAHLIVVDNGSTDGSRVMTDGNCS